MASPLFQEISTLDSLEPSLDGTAAQSLALQALVDSAVRLLDADRVTLILFDWKARQVSRLVRGGPGWADVLGTVGFDELTRGLSGWVLKTGRVARSPKDVPDPRESPEVQFRRRETRCGSILVAPLGNGQRRLGTLTAINRSDQRDFSEDEARDFGVLAVFGAGMIHLAQARQEAEAAVRSKMNFLSNLSHELRTPLNGILGFSHLLSSTDLAPGQKPMVQTILESGNRLLSTVDNVLDLAQIEAGQLQLEISPFSPRSVLDAVAARYSPLAAEKGLTWTVEAASDLPAVLEGDAVRLGQAWGHILSNAVKFTPRGGITLTLGGRTTVRDWYELRLEVKDTGIGISPSPGSPGPQPFEQGDGSLTRQFGGTGLGLALCDRIVRKMGGGLSLAGEPGVGTQVQVWVELGFEGQGLPVSLPGLRILLQNSDPVTELALVKMLEKAGHAVDLVPAPEEVESRMLPGSYDVLVVEPFLAGPGLVSRWSTLADRFDFHLVGLYPSGSEPNTEVPWTASLFVPLTYPSVLAALDRCYSRRKP
jgi:signal transduction histidine kinase